MKHDVLRSIAHNIADSLASGIGLLVGVYEIDIFGEASRCVEGYISVNFLAGTTQGGSPSSGLAETVRLYSEALPGLCERQNASIDFFRVLTAKYFMVSKEKHAIVTLVDKNGRLSTDEYFETPLTRLKTHDNRGRSRKKRS